MTESSEQLAAQEDGGRSFADHASSGYTPDEDECFHALLVHLIPAIANVLFLGILIPVISPLTILLVTKERRPFLLFHLSQSIAFQALLFGANIVLVVLVSLVTILTWGRGADLYFLSFVFPFLGVIFGLRVGLVASSGEWRKCPIVGEHVLYSRQPSGFRHRIFDSLKSSLIGSKPD